MNEPRPILIYDGKCSFCGIWIRYLQKLTVDRVEYATSQEVGGRYPEIPSEAFKKSVWLVLPDGTRFRGAQAVFKLLACGRGKTWPLRLSEGLPGFAYLSETMYGFIARHRSLFYWITRLLWGREIEAPSSGLTRSLFLRGLAVVYVFAFASLIPQIIGLVGERGLIPARDVYPTIAFFPVNDAFLRTLPWIGIALAVLLFFRVAPMAAVVGLYLLYLVVARIGQDFFAFQWDALLLEAGFAAILVTPFGLLPSYRRSTSRIGIWVFRVLIFRLMLESGLVKLLSGDSAWGSLTALEFHFETQPLPTPLAWYAHQLPATLQKISCAGVLVVELLVPFLFLMPRRLRISGAWITIALQLMIALTGNYTFFNLLTITLCLFLFDDQHLSAVLRRPYVSGEAPPRQWRWATIPLGTLLIVLGMLQLLALTDIVRPAPEPFAAYGVVNRYGLFAVMTTSRQEIVIEGSEDGEEWKAYEFKFKPGDTAKPLPWVAPYQPRLDWQLWFAALSGYRSAPWFSRLVQRLLEGSPEVLSLLANNPFPGKPPRVLRAVAYDYHFTDALTRRSTDAIWTRTLVGEYFPAVSLR